MTQLIADFKKWLTGELGECSHEFRPHAYAKSIKVCIACGKSFNALVNPQEGNRTFTTWQDFGDVLIAAQKKKWWGSFVRTLWNDGDYGILSCSGLLPIYYINPSTFFCALQEFWEINVKEK